MHQFTKLCPYCSKPMKILLTSFYCDCKKEVKESNYKFTTAEDAFYYAKYIDVEPSENTRKIACMGPIWACYYAFEIDKCPRDDTRAAACTAAKWAFFYAQDVDKCKHPDTEKAVKDSSFERRYRDLPDPKPTPGIGISGIKVIVI